ncbi:MAG TPA: hypothetical protein V6D25_00435 [Leptolyngbyaceae cyanobacterium]
MILWASLSRLKSGDRLGKIERRWTQINADEQDKRFLANALF